MGKIHKHGINYTDITNSNLYKFLLQRNIDIDGQHGYKDTDFVDVLNDILNSKEYLNLKENKKFESVKSSPVDYTILKINDRAFESLKNLHSILIGAGTYHDIEFINYQTTDIYEFFEKRNIKINWMADLFGLLPNTTPSELAVTASHVLAMEYLIEQNLDALIVFEDDVVLDKNFKNILSCCMNDLPNDYDFLADSTLLPDYQEFSTEESDIILNSNFICRAHLQNSHTGMMMYSKQGAKKILDLYKKYGIICSIDTFLFWLGRRGDLNAYTTFYTNKLLADKDIYGSMVVNKRTL